MHKLGMAYKDTRHLNNLKKLNRSGFTTSSPLISELFKTSNPSIMIELYIFIYTLTY